MTVVRFTDGRSVDVVDSDCEFRPCFTYGLDRGPFVPGQGYTNPRGHVPRPVCNTRHLHGCSHKPASEGVETTCDRCDGSGREDDGPPCVVCRGSGKTVTLVLLDPLPCCETPRLAVPRGEVYSQTCLSCGTRLRDRRLEVVRELVAKQD